MHFEGEHIFHLFTLFSEYFCILSRIVLSTAPLPHWQTLWSVNVKRDRTIGAACALRWKARIGDRPPRQYPAQYLVQVFSLGLEVETLRPAKSWPTFKSFPLNYRTTGSLGT